jgi:uncharacterized membrane protein
MFPSWGVLFLALGWVPGISVWQLVRREGPTFSIGTKGVAVLLTHIERRQALTWGVVSLLLLGAVYVVLFLLKRRRDPEVRYDSYFRALNSKFLLLLTLPGLAAIFTTHFEGRNDFLNLTVMAATVAIFSAWVYAIVDRQRVKPSLAPSLPPAAPVGSWGPWLVVAALFCLYVVGLSYLSIIDHRNLNTANWDLGIYDNIFWNSAHGNFLGCSFCRLGKHYSAHFDPILWMLTPIYRLSPRAETLLILQSFWLALGGIPLFLYARRLLGHGWWACTVVAAYYFMPALHGANLYDFHSLVLLVPTAIFAIYFLDTRRFVGYWASIALLLLTREDMSLLSCFIGIYAWFTGSKKTAVATVAIALAYLGVVKLFIMSPNLIMDSASGARSFTWYYKEAIPYREEGVAGLIVTLLSDPIATLAVVFQEKKLVYFTTLLLPVLFLPLISGKKRILMLYGLMFIGLATRKYVYSAHFQYSSLLIPFLAMSVADAIVRLRDARWLGGFGLDAARLQRALLVALVLASALMGAEYGALAPNESFRAGWSRLEWVQSEKNKARYDELQEVIARIPSGASVSTQSRVGPHVTNRAVVYQWPKVSDVDYILLSGNSPKGRRSKKFRDLLAEHKYEIDYESKAFVLVRRVTE